jgi:DNA modification methylase
MTPYFDQDGITIYHADCRDVLPTIDPASVDLVLTDPPYGIDLDTDYAGEQNKNRGGASYLRVAGDDADFDPLPLLAFGRCVIWGANNFASRLPDYGNWFVWDKVTRNDLGVRIAECELAWTNFLGRTRCYRHMWSGAFRDSERGTAYHPTQKPVSLMRWILDGWTEPGDLILDPYMGSGPVAQACHEMGRRYIGIEIEERYCEIAVSRLGQQVLPLGAIS